MRCAATTRRGVVAATSTDCTGQLGGTEHHRPNGNGGNARPDHPALPDHRALPPDDPVEVQPQLDRAGRRGRIEQFVHQFVIHECSCPAAPAVTPSNRSRMLARARACWLLTVPAVQPSASAVCSMDRPS